MSVMKFITTSVKETIEAGENFGQLLKPYDGVLFKGGMGAGKTHFTKGIGRAFGITDEIVSPTFALVNEYLGRIPLFHFDLFRINDFDGLYSIGFFDYLERSGVIVAEWSENIPNLIKEFKHVYIVEIISTGEDSRKITIEKIFN